MKEQKKNTWWKFFPVVTLVSFIIYILSLVAMTSGKTPEHVEKNYYQKDIESNAILAEYANANRLESPAEFKVDHKAQQLSFLAPKITEGTLLFSRPSDSKADKQLEFTGPIELAMTDFISGKWKVEVLWTDGQQNYRIRKDFFVE
ncbi:FixH family protein [Lentisphaera profundi]|uniref:FixH family protein n=1 Tax=Lentisphaera profundi TaxID=1658616 RepID=A0ABY7VS98_9BACT|nr:FixH family protein [Lentisphaera profundi]WDE95726.1 FixH family protein [Lentisphaera profundi]